jgi:hypothetical protein
MGTDGTLGNQEISSGFYVIVGNLGSINSLSIAVQNYHHSGSVNLALNLWFDTGNDGDFFSWNPAGVFLGTNSDYYVLGECGGSYSCPLNASNTTLSVNDGTTFSHNSGGGGAVIPLSSFKQGLVPPITSGTYTAIWIGLDASGSAATKGSVDIILSPLVITTTTATSTTATTTTFITTTTAVTTTTLTTLKQNVTLTGTTTLLTTSTATSTQTIISGVTTTGATQGGQYSISFSPQYWQCTYPEQITFTGPLTEEGRAGHSLNFVFSQYGSGSGSYQTNPLFTMPEQYFSGDSLQFLIQPSQWSSANFGLMPNLVVQVVDQSTATANNPAQIIKTFDAGPIVSGCSGSQQGGYYYSTVSTNYQSSTITYTNYGTQTVNAPGQTVTVTPTVQAPAVTIQATFTNASFTSTTSTFLTTLSSTSIFVARTLTEIFTATAQVTIGKTPLEYAGPMWVLQALALFIIGAIAAAAVGPYARGKFSSRLGGLKLPATARIWQRRTKARKEKGKSKSGRGPGRPRKERKEETTTPTPSEPAPVSEPATAQDYGTQTAEKIHDIVKEMKGEE